ncbi:hypothetical protein [Nocardioides sp. zg-DK7169]|uniref:hypothetical protein n=1 Tax=Nocardioides sp. zg-DK7169 TaxID=2736600 RepID=UPI001C130F81|nr:hypothetical protein [Nocardioides sp. zg-DK7169]
MSLRVRCTVEAMNYSACGLALGDHFDLTSTSVEVPEGREFCYFAIAGVITAVHGRLDAEEPDAWLRSRPLLACPDPPEALHLRVEVVPDPGVPTRPAQAEQPEPDRQGDPR